MYSHVFSYPYRVQGSFSFHDFSTLGAPCWGRLSDSKLVSLRRTWRRMSVWQLWEPQNKREWMCNPQSLQQTNKSGSKMARNCAIESYWKFVHFASLGWWFSTTHILKERGTINTCQDNQYLIVMNMFIFKLGMFFLVYKFLKFMGWSYQILSRNIEKRIISYQ